MELKVEVQQVLKGGRTAAKYNQYLAVYKRLTGKDYPKSNCNSCSLKYLYRFIENWYDKAN
jgi:hypothetical protein